MLDDLRRVDTDLAHAREARERLGNRIADLDREISAQERLLVEAMARRDARLSYLTYRVREQYKDGPDPVLRRLASRGPTELRRAGARTAAYLSDRDARWVVLHRLESERIDAERAQLVARREEHVTRRAEATGAERRLAALRHARERLLERIRDDRATRDAAIAELERAARELTERVDALGSGPGAGTLDVRKFRGLLD